MQTPKLFELRYHSELFGTNALFDRYETLEAAYTAKRAFVTRLLLYGFGKMADSVTID